MITISGALHYVNHEPFIVDIYNPFNNVYGRTREEVYDNLLKELRYNKWQVSEDTNSVDKIVESHSLILVKMPNSKYWLLKYLDIREKQ